MKPATEKRLWLGVEILTWVGLVGLIVYYTYWFGWQGLAYGILASALGAMIIYWFGDIIPIIGPLIRRWEANKRNSNRKG